MDVEEIKARVEAATKELNLLYSVVPLTVSALEQTLLKDDYHKNLSRLMAHSFKDIPALLSEVENLQTKLTETTAERDALLKSFNEPIKVVERGGE